MRRKTTSTAMAGHEEKCQEGSFTVQAAAHGHWRWTRACFHLIITANRLWMVALCWYHANISAHPSLTCQEATYVCKHFLRHIISTNSKILRLYYGLFTFFTSNSWSVCPLNWRVSWHLNSYTRVAAHEIPVRGSPRLKVGGQLNAPLEFCV